MKINLSLTIILISQSLCHIPILGIIMNLSNIYKNCPGCGSFKSKRIINCNNKSENLINSWINIHEERFFLPFTVCQKCSLYYVTKYFSKNKLDFLYNQLNDNNFANNDNAHLKTQNSYLELIKKHFEKKTHTHIIEYGPDLGILTEGVKRYYNPSKYFLIEPNTKHHPNLKKLSNTQIYENDDFINKLDNESIDLIIMVHVFDHILNPYEKLKILHKKMKKSGKIILVTHNTDSLLRFIQNKNWAPFCLYHPQLYNRKSLKILFKRSKFSKIKFSNTLNVFPLGIYLNGLTSLVNIKTNFKFGPNLKFPVGNIATISTK